MRSLVLGGSQFVGLHLVRELVSRGDEVTVLNRGKTATQLPSGVSHLTADRTDAEQMTAALTGKSWDAVYDVSGFVMVAGRSNIELLLDLLEGNTGAYVFTSSIMAYKQGAGMGVFPWTEDMPSNPDGPMTYGGFKVMVEEAVLRRHRERGFPGTVVRPAAIYGPNNNIYDMEAAMFFRLLRGLPIIIPHSGLVTGSYGHVDDLCKVMADMVAMPAAPGEIFNVTAEAVTTDHYVRVLAEIVGKPADVRYISDAELAKLPRQPFGHLFGRAHHAMLSIEKAQDMLGFAPEWDFTRGHAQTFEWFMKSPLSQATEALKDPLWFATYDFAYEAEVAAVAAKA